MAILFKSLLYFDKKNVFFALTYFFLTSFNIYLKISLELNKYMIKYILAKYDKLELIASQANKFHLRGNNNRNHEAGS